MSIPIPEEVDGANILRVTEEDLNVAQKQLLEKVVEDYKKACLGTYSVTKRGEAIQKNAFPKLCETRSLKMWSSFKRCSTRLCTTQR
jgi:hypothetical protein